VSLELNNRWSRYANFYLLQLCLQRGGICDYEITNEDRKRWLRSWALPKPKNPELLRAVLAAKRQIVEQATCDASQGDPWANDDFEDLLANAIQSALSDPDMKLSAKKA
jgi:hypothetical protein